MKPIDIVILIAIIGCISAIILYMRKRKKRCGGGCAGCQYAKDCNKKS